MANLISLERVSLVFGTSHVLDDVSLGVLTGDRIGVVGVNGGGKSTLLRVMAGLQDADSGRITKQGGADGIRIGMLSQEDALDPEWTIREAVLGDLPEHVWAGDPPARTQPRPSPAVGRRAGERDSPPPPLPSPPVASLQRAVRTSPRVYGK